MPQINPDPTSDIFRKFKDIFRRLHALEVTVPIARDSVYRSAAFDTASTSWVGDSGVTVVDNVKCFGNTRDGTNALVTGSCQVGLDANATGYLTVGPSQWVEYWTPSPPSSPIGGAIAVQIDGGGTFEPASGPGIYFLGVCQALQGGIEVDASGSRVIPILSPAATPGLSEHDFAMVFMSLYGQTVHFNARTLSIDPQ